MRKLSATLLSLLTAIPVLADGDVSAVPLADPYILLDNGIYYAYGTRAEDGIDVWMSNDLEYWYRYGLALDMDDTTETQWFWAPEVYYKNGQYIMYYSANEHLYVATGDSPLGPFVQQGTYQMNDLLGDEKCIDSHCFTDDDGQAYLFFVRFTDGNCIWKCELEDDYMTPRDGTLEYCFSASLSWETILGKVCEGPFMVKYGSKYFLTYSANDYTSQSYAVGCATSSSITDPTWGKYTDPILCGVEELVGTGHHSIFTDKDGVMRIVFHAHYSTTAVQTRRMYIGTVEFSGSESRPVLKMTDDAIIRPKRATTGIDKILAESENTTTWYTLSGQRIETPQRGVNIMITGGTARKQIVR